MRRIRALLLIGDLGHGGSERQVVELANNLDPRRVECHICSLSEHVPLATQIAGVEERLHIVKKRSRCDFTLVPRVQFLLRRLKIDVVHSFFPDADIVARLAGRFTPRPVVINSERNSGYRPKAIHTLAYRMTRNWFDLVIANSRAGASYHQRLFGHDASRYRVIYNGVDVQRFRPRARDRARAALGVGERVSLVGMFASFKPQKNHALLLAAAQRVVESGRHVTFVFVGDALNEDAHRSGDQKRRILKLVETLKLQSHCIFLGNRRDVEYLYPACDLTVLPSSHEGTPNAVLESMSCGVPVVVSDVADNRLIVEDSQTGLVVPPGDAEALAHAVTRLLDDDRLRRAMGVRGRRRIRQEFACERLAEETAGVYLDSVNAR